jgi:anti-sigma B factor antagonist
VASEQRRRREDPVVEVSKNGDSVVVRLVGELDLHNTAAVRRALLDSVAGTPERVVVDLAGVEFMDSTALAALVEARRLLPRRDGFVLAAPGLDARRALEVSGLDRHFGIYPSVEEALAASL